MKLIIVADSLRSRAFFTASLAPSPFLRLANTATHAPANLGLVNVASIELDADGWATIPYGESHHNAQDGRSAPGDETPDALKNGVIQRFTRENAETFAADFKSFLGRIKRAVVGHPVFKGHPDAPRFANIFRDKTERGTISDMEVTDAGLRLRPVLTTQGAADVASGWNQFSPYWDLKFAGVNAAGLPVYEPFKLHSIGLVPRGNIPGLSLVNADPLFLTMKKEIIELLALLGITVPPETADEAMASFLAQAKTKIGDLKPKAELDTAVAAKTKAEGDLATANASIETLKGEKITLANSHAEALKAERKERATVIVAAAVADGRIAAAEKDAKILTLANAADFTAEADAIAKLKPTLKTKSNLGDLGNQGRDQTDRQTQFLSLVNAHMEKTGEKDYDAAYQAVENSDAGKALVAAMTKPGSASAK
jgi:hypothetical protein